MAKHIIGTKRSSFRPTADEFTKNKKEEKIEIANVAFCLLELSMSSIVFINATAPIAIYNAF